MTGRILETRKETDGQTIYVLGHMLGATYQDYMDQCSLNNWAGEWSDEKHQHVALRKFMRFLHSDISEWLREQQAQVTYWIAPSSKSTWEPRYKHMAYKYGIGFRPTDPVESMFVLKWS